MSYQPVGIKFYDKATCKNMMLVTEGQFHGWLVYQHPDGQWVSLREATAEDRKAIDSPISAQPKGEI